MRPDPRAEGVAAGEPFELLVDGRTSGFATGAVPVGSLTVTSRVEQQGGGWRLSWSVGNGGARDVRVGRVAVRFALDPGRVLEHGWQSWSPVRSASPGAVESDRHRLPRWRRAEYFYDPERAGRVIVGEPFLVHDGGIVGFLGGERHFGSIECGEAGVLAVAHLDDTVLPAGEEVDLHPVWFATGDPGECYSTYATLWAQASGGRPPATRPLGWCSWYAHGPRFGPAALDEAIAASAANDVSLVQVDDGWQAEIGDWERTSAAWPSRAAIADSIAAADLTPGLWLAPFLAIEGGRLVAEHPDWVLRDRTGQPVRAMHHPQVWGGWALALDTENEAVLDHLRRTAGAIVADGFAYLKLDFLFAAALEGRRRGTRAAALRRGLEALREGAGDATIVAGGSPLAPAVGLVDAMRVSPDVTTAWLPRRPPPGLHSSAASARAAVATSVLRAPLHGRLWANDPDCLLLRPFDTRLSPEQRHLLADVAAGLGGWVMLSDDLTLYGRAEWDVVDELRRLQPLAAGPVDVTDPFATVVQAACGDLELLVDWSGPGRGWLQAARVAA